MSVQIRRRREASTFLSTYVGAQGELIVDTTNNRVQVHDGATPGGWPAAKLADVAARTVVADAAYTAVAGDRTIAFTALTAARTVTLPAAAAYPTGTQLLVVDESGACSVTTTITIARAGSDTINGATSAVLSLANGYLALTSNGASKWTIVDSIVGALVPKSYTVATLPAPGGSERIVFCSNARVFNGAGAQEAAGAGTGGLVTSNGSAWKIAGTNVTASA